MSADQHHRAILQQGLDALQITINPEPFLDYLNLLHTWNQAYNLTAVRNIDEMISRHLLDSLAILPYLQGSRLLDVGSGAGLPGIPLAIACPDRQITVLDSHGKKTRFLLEVKRRLALTNVHVVQSRVEEYHVSDGFDTVTSRAFTQLDRMMQLTQHLLVEDGLWVAMKSTDMHDELCSIKAPYQIVTYTVPGTSCVRCSVLIRNEQKKGK